MEWTDSALVLSLGTFRETDIWLRLLTARHGIVRVFAFGGSRSRRRFPGCLDIMNFLRVRVGTGRNGQFLNLQEASLSSGPRRLRKDVLRLGMMMNCVKFLEALEIPQENGKTTLALMQAMLTMLEEERHLSENLPVLFRLRLASDQGYVPSFGICAKCGTALVGRETETAAFWNTCGGEVQCQKCASPQKRQGWGKLSPSMLHALETVRNNPPHEWFGDGLARSERRECVKLVDEFVQYHLGLTWDRGRFGKS